MRLRSITDALHELWRDLEAPTIEGPTAVPRISTPWVLAFAGLALVKLWLVAVQDLVAFTTAAHDDALYANRALHLLAGGWLGPYDVSLLIKGPFYSFWIAAAHLTGMPLLLSHHLLYIAACVLLTRALSPFFGRRPMLSLWLYAVLLFNPMSYSDGPMTRIMREGIYPALTMLVTACAIALATRIRGPLRPLIAWSAGLGLSLGAFWMTREEGVWMLPTVLLLTGTAAVRVLQARQRLGLRLALLALPFALWMASAAGVAAINLRCYGKFTLVEIKSPEFRAAYGALSRAGAAHFRPYVPVPKEVRRQLYPLSPAFAELEPILESTASRGWFQFGCESVGVCDDFAGGWFLWALRGSVAAAGHHTSAPAAASFYQRLADEVNAACDQGRLPCGKERSSLAPVWRWHYVRPLAGAFLHGVGFFTRFDHFEGKVGLSVGPPAAQNTYRRLTLEHLAPTAWPALELRGWAAAPGTDIQVRVIWPNGAPAETQIRFRNSPKFHQALLAEGRDLPEARRARFILRTRCTSQCTLWVMSGGRVLASAPLDGREHSVDRPDLLFLLEAEEGQQGLTALDRDLDWLKTHLLYRLGRGFQRWSPRLTILALLIYLGMTIAFLVRRRRTLEWLVVTALGGALMARLLLLALIEVTSYRALHRAYLSPAYPLLLTCVVLLLVIGGRQLGAWLRRRLPIP